MPPNRNSKQGDSNKKVSCFFDLSLAGIFWDPMISKYSDFKKNIFLNYQTVAFKTLPYFCIWTPNMQNGAETWIMAIPMAHGMFKREKERGKEKIFEKFKNLYILALMIIIRDGAKMSTNFTITTTNELRD